jgi:tRNA pseudouridine55 synthase
MDGILPINKPVGITSRAAVERVSAWFGGIKAGHAGTLDPLAGGVLVIGLGAATRLLEYVQRMTKTYRATIRLGATSTTDDAAGTIVVCADARRPSEEEVRHALARLGGEIDQVPPDHSAVLVAGQRAFQLARKGMAVSLRPRRVRIDRTDLLGYDFPAVEIRVECGKGTYIRAIARDVGRHLGCGAYLTALTRTRIGSFELADAVNLENPPAPLHDHVLPMQAAVAELPAVRLPTDSLLRLHQGQSAAIAAEDSGHWARNATEVAVFDMEGSLAAIADWHPEQCQLTPRKVFIRSQVG